MTRVEFVDAVIALLKQGPDGQEQEFAEALLGLGLGMFESLGLDIEEIIAALRRNHKPLREIGRLS